MPARTKAMVARLVVKKLSALRVTLSNAEQSVLDEIVIHDHEPEDDVEAHAVHTDQVIESNKAEYSAGMVEKDAAIRVVFNSEIGGYQIQ